MALFRDLTDVILHGESGDPGCQSVSLECSADEITHSSCDEDFVTYLGLLNQSFSATATFAGGALLLRDIGDMKLGSKPMKHALTAELVEMSEEITGGDDGDCFLTFVGVTKRQVEVTATFRDVIDGKTFSKGETDTFSVTARSGSSTSFAPCPDLAGKTFTAAAMTVTALSCTATHGELAEFSVTMKSATEAGSAGFTGSVLTGEIRVGECGDLSWKKRSVGGYSDCDTGKSYEGSDETFTLSPTVATERRVSLSHGEMTTESISVRAYSLDGSMSPLS